MFRTMCKLPAQVGNTTFFKAKLVKLGSEWECYHCCNFFQWNQNGAHYYAKLLQKRIIVLTNFVEHHSNLEKLLQGDPSCLLQTSFLGIRVQVMDLSSSKGLTQRQRDPIDKSVYETIKCIVASLKAQNNNFDNDLFFYTPPSSPSEPISNGLEAHLHVNQARRWSCIIFNVQLKIYNQLVHPKNHVWVSSNSWIY